MIGILIAAHQDMGAARLRAAEGIVGSMDGVETLAVSYDVPTEEVRERLGGALRRLDEGQGVLILTDMFGGTPTNMSLPFLEEGRVEVLTGVNLPMLLKANTARQELGLGELGGFLRDYAVRNVVLASEIWKTRPLGRK